MLRPFLHSRRQDTTHSTPAPSLCGSFATRSRCQARGWGRRRHRCAPSVGSHPTLQGSDPAQAEQPPAPPPTNPRLPEPRPPWAGTHHGYMGVTREREKPYRGFTLANSPPLGLAPGRAQPPGSEADRPRDGLPKSLPCFRPEGPPPEASIATLGGGKPKKLGGSASDPERIADPTPGSRLSDPVRTTNAAVTKHQRTTDSKRREICRWNRTEIHR